MTAFRNVTLPCKIEGRFPVAGPWFGAVKVSILKQGIRISVWAWQELHKLPMAMASSFNDPCWQIWWVQRKEKASLSLSLFLVSKTCCHVLPHAFFFEMNVVFINILVFFVCDMLQPIAWLLGMAWPVTILWNLQLSRHSNTILLKCKEAPWQI